MGAEADVSVESGANGAKRPSSAWFARFAPTPPKVTSFDETRRASAAAVRLLPAILFIFSFMAVMIFLVLYIGNAALHEQQFRQNMRREDELANIAQDNEALVAFMRRWILINASQPFPPHARHVHSAMLHKLEPTDVEMFIAQKLNYKRGGVFVELGAYGSAVEGNSRTAWLEKNLGWHGLVVTPDAHDYFRLRAHRKEPNTLTAQACLSTSVHPKEITYQENGFHNDVIVKTAIVPGIGGAGEEFSARVKCFPLYSFLLASKQQHIDFLSLSCGGCEVAAFTHLPYNGKVHMSIIEIVGKQNEEIRTILASRGYSVAKKTQISTIYILQELPTVKI